MWKSLILLLIKVFREIQNPNLIINNEIFIILDRAETNESLNKS